MNVMCEILIDALRSLVKKGIFWQSLSVSFFIAKKWNMSNYSKLSCSVGNKKTEAAMVT